MCNGVVAPGNLHEGHYLCDTVCTNTGNRPCPSTHPDYKLRMQPCQDASNDQRWYVADDNQISTHSDNPNRCFEVTPGAAPGEPPTTLTASTCNPSSSYQKWVANGRPPSPPPREIAPVEI